MPAAGEIILKHYLKARHGRKFCRKKTLFYKSAKIPPPRPRGDQIKYKIGPPENPPQTKIPPPGENLPLLQLSIPVTLI